KITNFEWLDNSHYQSYLVLNLCRILYTVYYGETGTKKVSAEWVKNHWFKWNHLVETAENWKYGKEMKMQNETIHFIKFVIDEIKRTKIYEDMYSKNDFGKYDISHISDFLISIRSWAEQNSAIDGVALVGSYARNEATIDSD